MSIPSFLRYPKFAASTGVNEFSHPNTAKFERNMAVQDRVIDSVKLRHIVLTLPGYETLSYAYDKTFWVDGMRLSYPIVICVGYAKGSLWASPDGNVIRETKKPFDEWSIFWTTDTAAEIPLAPFSKVPDPFDKCAVLRDGLKTPMGAESQALVRYYTTLRAQDSGLTKYSIEFPDLAVLLNVLRLLALPGGDDRYNFPKDLLEQGLKPQKVSELPPSPNAAKELLTQDCVTWSKGLLTTHNHMQTSSPKLVACNESLESPVQAVHQRYSNSPSIAWPTSTIKVTRTKSSRNIESTWLLYSNGKQTSRKRSTRGTSLRTMRTTRQIQCCVRGGSRRVTRENAWKRQED